MKKFLIGCGIAALCALVFAIIFAVSFGPRVARWGGDLVNRAKDEIGREQARTDALQRWKPRAPDAPADVLFPVRVGTASRLSVQDGAVLNVLGISRPARQAHYSDSGATVEVWAYPVNELEKEGLIAQIRSAHERGSGAKTTVTLPSRSSFSSPSIGTNHVISPPGWVFIFRPQTDADSFPFIDAFFRAPVEAAAPLPADPAATESVPE